MAAKNEAFLSLEGTLADTFRLAYRSANKDLIEQIGLAVSNGEIQLALELLDELDVSQAIAEEGNFIGLIGMSAILFGARDFAKADDTVFSGQPPPPILGQSTLSTELSATAMINQNLRQQLLRVITAEGTAQRLNGVATPGVAKKITGLAIDAESRAAQLVASLHVSRMASWGHLVQAEAEGVETYRVSEILDRRTCPICIEMDGRVFQVGPARRRIEQQLSVENPDDLKALAPWPNQSKAGVAAFKTLSEDELVANGWDTPPYHALCRGVLVRVS